MNGDRMQSVSHLPQTHPHVTATSASVQLAETMAAEVKVALYRACLSAVRAFKGDAVRLRLPLHKSQATWPGGRTQSSFLPNRSAAREIFPRLAAGGDADAPELSLDTVRDLIRTEFRRLPTDPAVDPVSEGLDALKALHLQLDLAERSSCVRTELADTPGVAVVIEASSAYRGRDGPQHVFTYRIRVYNAGTVPVQVVGRCWTIRNADGTVHASVPRGSPGIVGQMPRLEPGGECFEYASGTTLATPGGDVSGSLQMVSHHGEDVKTFDAKVGTFPCLVDAAAEGTPRER